MLESVPSSSRRDALAEILRSNGTIEIGTAAKEFDVHAMTIRRDLEHLERTGRARRVRGGAVSVEEHFDVRAAQMVGAKRKIAGKLAALIPNTGAICVDASTTALQVVFEMRDANGLSVITNGLATFDALQQVPGVHAYLSGGRG